MDAFSQVSLFSGSPEVVGAVAGVLTEIGCCARCALRFLGERRYHAYRDNHQELYALVRKLVTLKPLNGDSGTASSEVDRSCDGDSHKPCVVCLGVLQEFCTEKFAQKISDCVYDAGFQYNEHICSLMLPPCIIIREQSLWLHLEDTFPEVYKNCTKESVPTIKDVWKWTMGNSLSEKLCSPFEIKAQFDICITFSYSSSDAECKFLTELFPDTFKKRKTNKKFGWEVFSRASVMKAVSDTADSTFKRYYSVPPSKPKDSCKCESVVPSHKQIYLAGRYNKYSRSLSQTPWLIEGKKKTESSVEELVCNRILPHFKPDDYKFSASGREDVDVRMLGSGRPFVIELINPHIVTLSAESLRAVQDAVNNHTKDIAVRDLQIVPREETSILKDGEVEKTKSYVALCWCAHMFTSRLSEIIQKTKDLKLFQKTPIRVLHRRSLAVRERTVYNMRAERVDDHHFHLHLSTQAGTYIKEFVHSDLGRTTPSLGALLDTECDILELDVESVDIDWPMRIEADISSNTGERGTENTSKSENMEKRGNMNRSENDKSEKPNTNAGFLCR